MEPKSIMVKLTFREEIPDDEIVTQLAEFIEDIWEGEVKIEKLP